MSRYNDNFPEIFAKLKDGDCLGFYRGGIFKYFIPLATGGKCNHVGAVLNVIKEGDVLSFNFFQQSFKGGTFDVVRIYKTDQGIITDDPYFIKQDKIYFCSLITPLTEEQKNIAIADAISQRGKIYHYSQLFLGFSFLDKILSKSIKDFIYEYSKNLREVCSNNMAFFYRKLGFPVPKDFFSTPIEVINFPFFKR